MVLSTVFDSLKIMFTMKVIFIFTVLLLNNSTFEWYE